MSILCVDDDIVDAWLLSLLFHSTLMTGISNTPTPPYMPSQPTIQYPALQTIKWKESNLKDSKNRNNLKHFHDGLCVSVNNLLNGHLADISAFIYLHVYLFTHSARHTASNSSSDTVRHTASSASIDTLLNTSHRQQCQ